MSEARRAPPQWPAAVTAAWPDKLRDLPVSTKNGGSHTRKPTALADALDTITALPSDATKGDRKKALEARRLVEHLNATAPCVEGLWVVDLYCVRDATGLSFSSTRAALAKLQIDGWLDFEWTNPKRVGAEVWLSWVAVHSITTQNAHQWFTSALANRPKSALQTRVAENLAGTSSTSTSTSSSYSTAEPEPTDQPRPPEHNSSSLLKTNDPPEQAAAEPEATAPHDNPAGAFEEGSTEADRLVSALRCAQQRQGIDDRYAAQQSKLAAEFLRTHSYHDGLLGVALREQEHNHREFGKDSSFLNAAGAWRLFDANVDRLIDLFGKGFWQDTGHDLRWIGPGYAWTGTKADEPDDNLACVSYRVPMDDEAFTLEIEHPDAWLSWRCGRLVAGNLPRFGSVDIHRSRMWRLVIAGTIDVVEPEWCSGYEKIDGVTLPNPDSQRWVARVHGNKIDLPEHVRDFLVERGMIDTERECVETPAEALKSHNALWDRLRRQLSGINTEETQHETAHQDEKQQRNA